MAKCLQIHGVHTWLRKGGRAPPPRYGASHHMSAETPAQHSNHAHLKTTKMRDEEARRQPELKGIAYVLLPDIKHVFGPAIHQA